MNKATYPTIPVTDPRFVYVPAVSTDVRITWRKAQRVNNILDRIKEPKNV